MTNKITVFFGIAVMAAVLFGSLTFSQSAFAGVSTGDKVTICHVDQETGEEKTISVGAKSVPAHLANHEGDHVGECVEAEPDCSVSPNPLEITIYTGFQFSTEFTNVGCLGDLGSARAITTDCFLEGIIIPFEPRPFASSISLDPKFFSTDFEFLVGDEFGIPRDVECTLTWETDSEILGIQSHVQTLLVTVENNLPICEDCLASAQLIHEACIADGADPPTCDFFFEQILSNCSEINELEACTPD